MFRRGFELVGRSLTNKCRVARSHHGFVCYMDLSLGAGSDSQPIASEALGSTSPGARQMNNDGNRGLFLGLLSHGALPTGSVGALDVDDTIRL